ncbi:MAG: Fur family transcriptional regulator, peroxide stress response regulator [Bryobacterales bacterium]|nr:Fur family transcriptional regulator, peroxide stress response regulator [Bryobacterales bacterium]
MSKLETAQKIEQAFERTGVRRTPQRFFVLERLLTKPDHATVEELWAALNRRHARASRATVYNTLHALVQAGLVREFTLDGKAARYDANLERHHHFVCDSCGAVEDVNWFDVPQLEGNESEKRSIRSYEVTLRGKCAKCHSNN